MTGILFLPSFPFQTSSSRPDYMALFLRCPPFSLFPTPSNTHTCPESSTASLFFVPDRLEEEEEEEEDVMPTGDGGGGGGGGGGRRIRRDHSIILESRRPC